MFTMGISWMESSLILSDDVEKLLVGRGRGDMGCRDCTWILQVRASAIARQVDERGLLDDPIQRLDRSDSDEHRKRCIIELLPTHST
jgi:hypothetical protein